MRFFARVWVVALILMLLAVESNGSAQTAPSWQTVPSPNNGSLANSLAAIVALSNTDIWAVGEFNPGLPPTVTGRRTLALHWNGSTWAIVPTPNATWQGVDLSTLEDVDALTTDDVWAVGHADDFSTLKSTTLVLHWNGGVWTIIPSPNPAGGSLPNQLLGIAAITPADVWAVGYYGYDPVEALTIHWNGSIWSMVPNPGTRPLVSVAAVSTSDVWAVSNSSEILHWNGASWTVVPSPQPTGEFFVLEAVAAVSASSVWAVGYTVTFNSAGENPSPSNPPSYSPLIERWNGNSWSRVGTTLPGGYRLYGVEAVSTNRAWAVGSDSFGRTLIARWNGKSWKAVGTPALANGGGLRAVRALSTSDAWAVGFVYDANAVQRTLIEHYGP